MVAGINILPAKVKALPRGMALVLMIHCNKYFSKFCATPGSILSNRPESNHAYCYLQTRMYIKTARCAESA